MERRDLHKTSFNMTAGQILQGTIGGNKNVKENAHVNETT